MRSQSLTAASYQTSTRADTLALLTFKVAEQEYGLPVASIIRIIEMVTLIPVPDGPEVITGLINFHGKAVPVMDLRQRFGLAQRPYGLYTPIILADMDHDGRALGLIVDTVEDVFNIPAEDLEIAETIVPIGLVKQLAIDAAHLAGVVKVDQQLILVLTSHALLNPAEKVELLEKLERQDHELKAKT